MNFTCYSTCIFALIAQIKIRYKEEEIDSGQLLILAHLTFFYENLIFLAENNNDHNATISEKRN